jgi:DNA repair protein RadC
VASRWPPALNLIESKFEQKFQTLTHRPEALAAGGTAIGTQKAPPEDMSGRPQTGEINEQNTRYELSEPPRRDPPAPGDVRSESTVPAAQILANAVAPGAANAATRLAQSVRLEKIGQFRSGHKKVGSWMQAAHILAPIRKSPQEVMAALVLDKKGKPLAVIRHTIGMAAAASVENWSLAGAIAHVPGAAQVYFGHNHPSGTLSQSQADNLVTYSLYGLLQGTGIEPKGMIVVAPGQSKASFYDHNHYESQAPIAAAPRTKARVPIMGRRLASIRRGLSELSTHHIKGPDDAKDVVRESGMKAGIILLDNRQNVVGLIHMDPQAMRKLRTGNAGTGAAQLLRDIAAANASKAMTVGPAPAARNAGMFLNAAHVSLLDTFQQRADGTLERGDVPSEHTYLAQGEVTPEEERRLQIVRDLGLTPPPRFSREAHQKAGGSPTHRWSSASMTWPPALSGKSRSRCSPRSRRCTPTRC